MTHANDTAFRLAARGNVREEVARLQLASDQGDAAASFDLAICYLIGDIVPRDVPLARSLLRKAAIVRHPDAIQIEIALTANGSGAPADWAGALKLLEQAAIRGDAAAAQLSLLRAMKLDAAGNPEGHFPMEALSAAPSVGVCRSFLTRGECEHIARAAAALLAPAQVFDPTTGKQVSNPIRTSDEAVLGPTREDLVVGAINRRIAMLTGTDIRQGESLTILRYRERQQYRAHLDALPNTANQRIVTALIYLNEGFGGGETVFPKLGLSVVPRAGDVLVFDNVGADGKPDPRAVHAGVPVTRGSKWVATRWIRRETIDPWNHR